MSSQKELAEVSVENFPELAVQYPEFGLQKFAVCISAITVVLLCVNTPSTSCASKACPMLTTSLEQIVNSL